jgi:hypothetical protein
MHITLHINYTEFKLIILNLRQFIGIEIIVFQINRVEYLLLSVLSSRSRIDYDLSAIKS